MFPKSSNDLINSVAKETGHSEKDVKDLIYFFYQKFIPGKIKSLDENSFLIKHLGMFEVEMGNIKGMMWAKQAAYKRMVKEEYPEERLKLEKAELEAIELAYEAAYNKRQALKKHYNEYKEKSTQYQKDMEEQGTNRGRNSK